jgi:hypothetical protein
MSAAIETTELMARPAWQGWLSYWALWLGVGLSLALASWQDPNHRPGRAVWEPFVLEISSLLASGLLGLAVYRLARVLHDRRPFDLLGAHLLGAVVFALAHLVLMHLVRWPFYWVLADRHYGPLPWLQALGFEGAKDVVTYFVIAALCHGWLWRQREQAQRLDAARAMQLQTELRLTQLGARLQPHFLFNSLNAVASLVEENPRLAVHTLARLGDYLRGSLRGGESPERPLAEEVQSLQDYLAIQAMRFEDTVSVQIDVPAALGHTPVPRLLLQPLVENAITHGAPAPESPLLLRLRAWSDGQSLWLSLYNHPARPQDGGTGLGQDLAREQLRLLHGDAADLEAGPDDAGGYEVRLHLPRRV